MVVVVNQLGVTMTESLISRDQIQLVKLNRQLASTLNLVTVYWRGLKDSPSISPFSPLVTVFPAYSLISLT